MHRRIPERTAHLSQNTEITEPSARTQVLRCVFGGRWFYCGTWVLWGGRSEPLCSQEEGEEREFLRETTAVLGAADTDGVIAHPQQEHHSSADQVVKYLLEPSRRSQVRLIRECQGVREHIRKSHDCGGKLMQSQSVDGVGQILRLQNRYLGSWLSDILIDDSSTSIPYDQPTRTVRINCENSCSGLADQILQILEPHLQVLSQLCRKMMKKNPNFRPSASELLQEEVFVKLMKEYTKKKKIDSLDLREVVPKQLLTHKNKASRLLPPLLVKNTSSPTDSKIKVTPKSKKKDSQSVATSRSK